LNALISFVRFPPKTFLHNLINLNWSRPHHTGRNGTTFHCIVLVEVHVYIKQITQYTHFRYFEMWFSLTKLKYCFLN